MSLKESSFINNIICYLFQIQERKTQRQEPWQGWEKEEAQRQGSRGEIFKRNQSGSQLWWGGEADWGRPQ